MPAKQIAKQRKVKMPAKFSHDKALTDVVDIPIQTNKGITIEDIISLKVANPALSIAQASKVLGCAHTNILGHLQRNGLKWASITQAIKDFRCSEADLVALKRKKMLESITDEDIKSMSAHNKVVDYGILVDKEAVLMGKGNSGGSINISFTWGAPQGEADQNSAPQAQVVIEQE